MGLVLRLYLLGRHTYCTYYYYYYCCYYYYYHHHYHNTTLVFTIAKLGSELDLQPPCVDLQAGFFPNAVGEIWRHARFWFSSAFCGCSACTLR
jgi:hypothetical protein